MLDEQKGDVSLERIMEMAEDDVLKAKNPEEKERAWKRYSDIHKIYNERLKIQNDRYVSEGKMALDAEKLDSDKIRQEFSDKEERSTLRKDRIIRIAFKVGELGLVTGGLVIQALMIHNNLIETDMVSKGMSKNLFGRLGDYLRG